MFTVPQSTVGFFENAGPTALSRALERGNRTVMRARIAACGATRNLLALLSQPTSSVGAINNGVPRRHLHSAPRRTMVGVQPTPAPGRFVQKRRGCEPGVQPQASRPPLARSRHVGGRCVTAALRRSDAFLHASCKPLSLKDMSGYWDWTPSRALPVTDPVVSAPEEA